MPFSNSTISFSDCTSSNLCDLKAAVRLCAIALATVRLRLSRTSGFVRVMICSSQDSSPLFSKIPWSAAILYSLIWMLIRVWNGETYTGVFPSEFIVFRNKSIPRLALTGLVPSGAFTMHLWAAQSTHCRWPPGPIWPLDHIFKSNEAKKLCFIRNRVIKFRTAGSHSSEDRATTITRTLTTSYFPRNCSGNGWRKFWR